MKLGIDIGRVIMAPTAQDGRGDSTFLNGDEARAMAVPPAPGAFESIARLVKAFAGDVWLVSKAGPRVQQRSMQWFAQRDFHVITGIPPERVRFCRERRDKALHAVELGLTHFVDDRADVLAHLHGIVPVLILFGHQAHPPPPYVTQAPNWAEAERLLLASLPAAAGHLRAP